MKADSIQGYTRLSTEWVNGPLQPWKDGKNNIPDKAYVKIMMCLRHPKPLCVSVLMVSRTLH